MFELRINASRQECTWENCNIFMHLDTISVRGYGIVTFLKTTKHCHNTRAFV